MDLVEPGDGMGWAAVQCVFPVALHVLPLLAGHEQA